MLPSGVMMASTPLPPKIVDVAVRMLNPTEYDIIVKRGEHCLTEDVTVASPVHQSSCSAVQEVTVTYIKDRDEPDLQVLAQLWEAVDIQVPAETRTALKKLLLKTAKCFHSMTMTLVSITLPSTKSTLVISGQSDSPCDARRARKDIIKSPNRTLPVHVPVPDRRSRVQQTQCHSYRLLTMITWCRLSSQIAVVSRRKFLSTIHARLRLLPVLQSCHVSCIELLLCLRSSLWFFLMTIETSVRRAAVKHPDQGVTTVCLQSFVQFACVLVAT